MNESEQAPSPNSSLPQTAPRRRRTLWAGAGLIVLGAVIALAIALRRNDPPAIDAPTDPRLEYAGPFRNLDPAAAYVPDQRCADCHADIARTYAQHPMGRSLVPAAAAPPLPLDPEHHNPFDALGARFLVERDDDRVRHRRQRLAPDGQPAAEQVWEVDFAIGSGRRGFSYLAERDGFVIQTPVSWYAQKQRWDLSPGFHQAQLSGRPVLPECLFCHSNRARHIETSVSRYTQPLFDGHAIGCQRCHGPGALHVTFRESQETPAEATDHTIVNPRRLDASAREGVCEQCHLVGEDMIARRGRDLYDFRPGLRPERFWSVLARAAEPGKAPKAVSHVEQMRESRCHERSAKSQRALGCISCHDPHRAVRGPERLTYYRNRCLACHEPKGCTELLVRRREKLDSCIDCHMPRYDSADVPHTASTDHRILRHGKAAHAKAAHPGSRPASLELPLVSLYRGRDGVDPAEDERARSIALVKAALAGDPALPHSLRHALPVLDAAVARAGDDLPAAEARAYALGLQGRSAEALAAFSAILSQAPQRERALVGAAATAERLEQFKAALDFWQRAVAVNPWSADYRRGLTLLLARMEAWADAQEQAEAWVRLDPLSVEARTHRIVCLLERGDRETARAEFQRIERLTPANMIELRIRFERRLK
ncbi:MAG: hypothetical protein L0Y71_04685 [Gemmataceae bacterium]|nr:hypothetical protein [Gemmataceae bacterium]